MPVNDFEKFCNIVKGNLKAKKCLLGRDNQNCIGNCSDCQKEKIYNKVVQRASADKMLKMSLNELLETAGEFEKNVNSEPIGEWTISERIMFYREYYDKQIAKLNEEDDELSNDIIDPINERGNMGRTPIIQAEIDGDMETVKRLLIEGADPYIKDNAGLNAIEIAIIEGMEEFVELWKECGYLSKD